MSLITPDLSGIVDGATADAVDFTNPINAIVNDYNGNIDNDNIASTAAISQSKIETSTLGYAQVTSNQTGITTETDLTGLSVTVTVPSGGRRIKITAFVISHSDTAADRIKLRIKEGATVLAASNRSNHDANDYSFHVCYYSAVATSGSHTYKLSLARDNGSGTCSINQAATEPGFILVEVI